MRFFGDSSQQFRGRACLQYQSRGGNNEGRRTYRRLQPLNRHAKDTFRLLASTLEQEEQFQVELAAFYTQILSDTVSLVIPTPSEHEVSMGDWVVRHVIAKGTYAMFALSHISVRGCPPKIHER